MSDRFKASVHRRNHLELMAPAERTIYDAAQAVEAMQADERLTAAVMLLAQARNLVADVIDGVPKSEPGKKAPLPEARCKTCGHLFTPSRRKQETCGRRCASGYRKPVSA